MWMMARVSVNKRCIYFGQINVYAGRFSFLSCHLLTLRSSFFISALLAAGVYNCAIITHTGTL